MGENEIGGAQTAMERLCRELMENVNSHSWCREHIPSVIEDIGDWEMWDYGKAIAAVRSDIERRIAEADLSDDKARDRALVDWRERIAELDALCRVLNAESADEAVAVARTMAEEHYELKELREAGRVMPEGVSWPRYEDGEPVRILDWFGDEEVLSLVFNMKGCALVARGDVYLAHSTGGDAIKRPAPKAVGADGREVNPGDMVWLDPKHREMALSTGPSHNLHYVSESECMTVSRVKNGRDCVVAWMEGEENRWCPASWLTHERPDSWGRLREDALKTVYAYWGCEGMPCNLCPAKIGDERPYDHYGTGTSCTNAIRLDLVARAERLAGVSADA